MASNEFGLRDTKKSNNTGLIFTGILICFIWFIGTYCFVTWKIGEHFKFHPALGKPISLGQIQIYSPTTVAQWNKGVWKVEQVSTILNYAKLGLLVPFGGMVLIPLLGGGPKRKLGDLHGSAHFADRKEIEQMDILNCTEGVYIGGWFEEKTRTHWYLRHNGPEHILCFAPTRSGKGVGLILPTLLVWTHSSVVLDIKGENFALTSGYLAQQGNRILRFDPTDASVLHPGFTGARYNPLEEVRLDTEKCISDVQQIAMMIMDPKGEGLKDYWEKAGFAFLAGAILHNIVLAAGDSDKKASLYDLSLMLTDPDKKGEITKLFEEMISTSHDEILTKKYPNMNKSMAKFVHTFCAQAGSEMLAKAKAEGELSGVMSQVTSNLSFYRDPVVGENTRVSDFHIYDLMNSEEAVNLYLIVPPSDIDRSIPLLRIMVSQLLGRVTEKMEFAGGGTSSKYNHRLLLMLDEFTSLGKLAIVERAIAYMAGYGVKGYFIVQDTIQLNQAYGENNALMANCHVRIAYAPNRPETAEYLSKLSGTATVLQKKKSRSTGKGGGSTTTNYEEISRPLITPDECQRLPGIHKEKVKAGLFKTKTEVVPGDMLIFMAGNAPIRGRQILHFKDPILLARAKMGAYMGTANEDDTITIKEKELVGNIPDSAIYSQETYRQNMRAYLTDDMPEGADELVDLMMKEAA